MRSISKFCALWVAFACLGTAAPGLLTWAPPGTSVVLGINLEQIKPTKTGQVLGAETDIICAALGQVADQIGFGPKVRQFLDQTGFDPRRDLAEIVLMASGSGPDTNGLLAIRGSFDLVKLRGLKSPGVTAGEYHGVLILTGARENKKTKHKEPVSVALVSPTMALLGDPETVRAAIDRQGKAGALDFRLMAKAELLSKTNDIWLAGRIPPETKEKMAASPTTAMFQSIGEFGGGIKFGKNVLIGFELGTGTPAEAKSKLDMLRGFIEMAEATQNQETRATLQKVDAHTEGGAVIIALSVPEEQFIKGLQAIAAKAAAGSASTSASASTPVPTPVPKGLSIYSSPSDMGTVKIDQ